MKSLSQCTLVECMLAGNDLRTTITVLEQQYIDTPSIELYQMRMEALLLLNDIDLRISHLLCETTPEFYLKKSSDRLYMIAMIRCLQNKMLAT